MKELWEKINIHFKNYRSLYGFAVFCWFVQLFLPDLLIELRKFGGNSSITYYLANIEGTLVFLVFGLIALSVLGFKERKGETRKIGEIIEVLIILFFLIFFLVALIK